MHNLEGHVERTLRSLGGVPFDHGLIRTLLSAYRRPNDKISELVSKGFLVPLRRGLYVLGASLRDVPVCMPLVANHLLGPSYVSLEFALNWHGLIPEGVFDVSSVTLKRSRMFSTPLGRFSYTHLSSGVYAMGFRMEQGGHGESFLMASPEKALCDLVMLTRHFPATSVSSMQTWLVEHQRMDEDRLRSLDLTVIRQCASVGYKSRQLGLLAAVLERL